MIDFFIIKNCFVFNVNQSSYFFNFTSRKFIKCNNLLFNKEDVLSCKGKLYELLTYEGVIEESLYKENPNYYRPILVTFLMSTFCNLKCTYCYAENPLQLVLNFDDAKKAVDFIISNALDIDKSFVVVKFHGIGEPTLNWECINKIYDYANIETRKYGIELKTSITTNGIVSSEQAEWLSNNMSQITISFDGFDFIQNEQRNHPTLNSFDEVLKTLNIVDLDKTSIKTTITNLNLDYMCKWTNYLADIGVKTIYFEPVSICGRAIENKLLNVDTDRFACNFLLSQNVGKERGIDVLYSGIKFDRTVRNHCGAYGNNFVVTPLRNISTCYEAFDNSNSIQKNFIIGSLDTTAQINIDEKALNKIVKLGKTKKSECQNCFAYYHCSGGCLYKKCNNQDIINETFQKKCNLNRKILYNEILKVINRDLYEDRILYTF